MGLQGQRRQQFLSESYYRDQMVGFDAVIDGDQGLEANLRGPEEQRGWHASLARSVGFETFNRLLLRYTAGEPIVPLRHELERVIAAYERYGKLLWRDTGDRNEVVFVFPNVDDYCELMQLIGLCFLLHRRDLLPRLAALQDGDNRSNGGTDWIYEEFLSYAPMQRHQTDHLCVAKPYQALSDALSSDDNMAALNDLDRFLRRWYKDLAGTGWHDSHKPDEGGAVGGYYGYWSFEAGAAVLLLGIDDDSSLHKYLYYPKDLVDWSRARASLSESDAAKGAVLRAMAGEPCPRSGVWSTPARADSRQSFRQGEPMPDVGGDYGKTIWQLEGAR